MSQVFIVAELWDGKIRPVTWELASLGLEIGGLMSPPVKSDGITVLVPGEHPDAIADEIAARTGMETRALTWSYSVTGETLTDGLASYFTEVSAAMFIMAHTTLGREVAPRLAARMGWDSVSGVTAVSRDEDGLLFERPVMDNTMIQPVRPKPDCPCILTLVPGSSMCPGDRETVADPGRVVREQVNPQFPRVVRREMIRPEESEASGPDIRTASIVVGAGQGIGEPENLKKIFQFAERLPGAAVGCSRPLVDRGFLPYSRQVGITGAVVAPELYIACGISGSSQHLAGMAGARWVVSINTSDDAPICRHSDLCISADVMDFIDAFMDEK